MTNFAETLMESGINYTEAMERFGGNADLYQRLAIKFLNDPHFSALEEALEEGDADQAFREAHSLKGVAGNLSFSKLYDEACRMSDALRNHDLATAGSLIASMRAAHQSVTTALKMMSERKEGNDIV